MDAWVIILFSRVQKPFSSTKGTTSSFAALGGEPSTGSRQRRGPCWPPLTGRTAASAQVPAGVHGQTSGPSLTSKDKKVLVAFNGTVSWGGKRGACGSKAHVIYSPPGMTAVSPVHQPFFWFLFASGIRLSVVLPVTHRGLAERSTHGQA